MPITDLVHSGTGGRAPVLSKKPWAKGPGRSVVRETVSSSLQPEVSGPRNELRKQKGSSRIIDFAERKW